MTRAGHDLLRLVLIALHRPRITLAAGAVLHGCASAPAPPTPPPVLVGTIPCEATVAVSVEGDASQPATRGDRVRPPMADLRTESGMLVTGGERRPGFRFELPAEFQVSWDAPIHERHDGTLRTDSITTVRFNYIEVTGGITGERLAVSAPSWQLPREVRCGSESVWTIALPVERKLRITSDPDSASIFLLQNGWNAPEFVGVAPHDLVLLWYPNRNRIGLLFRKSGYHDLREDVEPRDTVLRVILQPLPRRGDGHPAIQDEWAPEDHQP